MVKYLLDTSVVIEAIRLHKFEAGEIMRTKYKGKLFTTFITVAELFSGRSAQEKAMREFLEYLIGDFEILSINHEIAILAGQLKCFFKIDIADAFIAASAISNGTKLVSHNQKDFAKVPNLKVLKPK